MVSTELEQRLPSLSSLPATPVKLIQLIELLGNPDVCAEDVASALVMDQALSMTVMKSANSIASGSSEVASSIQDAFMRLGSSHLRRVILAYQSASLFKSVSGGFGLDQHGAWLGSVAGGLAAENLAKRTGQCDPAVAFTAGLLRDCGKVVMDELFGREDLERVLSSEDLPCALEREKHAFGNDHAEVGAVLAELWKLPSELTTVIRYHHEPPADNKNSLIDIVYCADMICAQLGYGVGLDGLAYELDEAVCKRVGLNLSVVCETLVDVRVELNSLESCIDIASDRRAA